MRRLLLLVFAFIVSMNINAQKAPNTKLQQSIDLGIVKKEAQARTLKDIQKKRATSGWLSYQDATYNSTVTTASYWPLTHDSSFFIPPTATGGNFYWWVHGMGTSFDPAAVMFNTPLNASYITNVNVVNSRAYTIDSIDVLGFYNRYVNGVVDTLIVELTPTTNGGTILSTKNVWFNTNLGIQDSTFRFADAQYDYTTNSMSSAVTSKVVIKKILDAAAFADTTSGGSHFFTLALPTPLTCAAGQKVAVFAHFKPGSSYPFGTVLDSANYWMHYAQEPMGTDTYPTVLGQDVVSGLWSTSADRYRLKDSAGQDLALFVSGTQYLDPTYWYGNTAGFDDPYFGFHVVCADCWPTSLDEQSNITNLFMSPNPATNYLSVVFKQTVNSKSTSISIINTLGAEVLTQNLGAKNGLVSTNFDLSNLSSGTYFCKIAVDGYTTTQKFVKQ